MPNSNNHGGKREGAGRPVTPLKYSVSVRISKEAYDILQTQPNKAEFIDKLIKESE